MVETQHKMRKSLLMGCGYGQMRCSEIGGMLEEIVIVTANVANSKHYFKGLNIELPLPYNISFMSF